MLRTVALVLLLVPCGACAGDRHAQAPPAQAEPPRAEQPEAMQVVPLQFASAGDLERELTQALGAAKRKGFRIVADPRTNSLIVVAAEKDDLARALELIARLDVKSPR